MRDNTRSNHMEGRDPEVLNELRAGLRRIDTLAGDVHAMIRRRERKDMRAAIVESFQPLEAALARIKNRIRHV